MIGPLTLSSLHCPEVLGQKESQGPKNKDFEKKNIRKYSSNLQLCPISIWLRYYWLL